MEKTDILQEITPLEEHDFMYVADRHKAEYDYPLHRHDLFEMNFVEHGAGCERIVGDSVETIGEYDLVLITSPNLEHMWGQGNCQNKDIHEITIQFVIDFHRDRIFDTNPMQSVKKMFLRAERGLAFPIPAIMTVYPRLIKLSQIKEGFYAMMELFQILYELSKFDDARELHIEQAKEAIDYQVWPEYRTSYDSTKPNSELIHCPYFTVNRVVVQVAAEVDLHTDSFVVVVCLWGEANINGIRVKQGETLLVPASENVLYIFGNATFLTATM